VLEVSGGFYRQQLVREETESALELVPQPLAERVRVHDDSTLVELVTEARLFTATVTADRNA
jgi:hypothetical protein